MSRSSDLRHAFYVVQFIKLPFEGVADYVCVPSDWLVVYQVRHQKAAVAYPRDEDPLITRDRARRRERHDDKWRSYMANVKFESDCYETSEFWIATRNDYGPLAQEEFYMNTQPIPTLNRALRSVDRNRSAATNDNPREPASRPATKRPGPSNANKRDGKRLKLSQTAQSSNSTEPGCSREQAIIIQDDEPIASVQARVITSNGDSRSARRTDERRNLQEFTPAIDGDTLAPVTQNDEEARTKVQRIQISGGPSITNEAQEPSIDNSSKPNSHNLLKSLKMSAHLYRDMNRARRLVPIGPPVEKRLRLMNTGRNSAETGIERPKTTAEDPRSLIQGASSISAAAQNVPSSSHQDFSSVRRVDEQRGSPTQKQHNITRSRQNQCPIDQSSFQRDPLRGSIERNDYDHRPNSRTIKMRIPLTRQNPANSSIPSNQTPQQGQSQPNRHSQMEQKRPKMHINVSIKPKKKRMSTLGGILDSLANSLRRALREGQVVHHELEEISPSESELVERHLNVHRKVCQTDDSKAAELLSSLPSGPSARADHLTVAGSSTDDQTHPRHVPEQRMLDNLATHYQMPSTSRPNILETAESDRNSSAAVDRFNTVRNSASNASLANVPFEGTSRVTEERLEGSTRHGSRNGNEQDSDVADNTQNKKHDNSRRSPVETINGHYPGTASGSSTDDRTHSRHILGQQMLDNFAALFNQMHTTLRTTSDMFNDLRSSILEAVGTFKNLLGAVETFNTVAGEVPVTEERLEGSMKFGSRIGNKQSRNVSENAQQNKAVGAINGRYPGITSGSSTNDQTHLRRVLEQQMLDNFAMLFNQMHSTSRVAYDLSNTLSSSILDTAGTYKNLLGSVETLNTVRSSASSAFMANVTIKAPLGTEGRLEGSTKHGSRSGNEQGNNAHQKNQKILPTEDRLKGSTTHGSRNGNEQGNTAQQEILPTEERLEGSTTHGSRSGNEQGNNAHQKILPTEERLEGSTTHGSRNGNKQGNTAQQEILPTEERLEGSTTHGTRNGNKQGNNVVGNTQQKKHSNPWRLVLPPEYDPDNTRWTLKYRENLPGLVEITPGSRVYVSYGDLKYCQQVSKDCKSLARRLLTEVFNRNALSVCLTMEERARVSDNVDSKIRPELDEHACSNLLNFVLEHGLQRGWNTDLGPILNTLESKMKEIRFRYGVMLQAN